MLPDIANKKKPNQFYIPKGVNSKQVGRGSNMYGKQNHTNSQSTLTTNYRSSNPNQTSTELTKSVSSIKGKKSMMVLTRPEWDINGDKPRYNKRPQASVLYNMVRPSSRYKTVTKEDTKKVVMHVLSKKDYKPKDTVKLSSMEEQEKHMLDKLEQTVRRNIKENVFNASRKKRDD